ncbi:hypothetical protein H6504_00395 [Candidatus Woesearchaeota archaeon]|nr:hypothetical protein [Candidatus Woesearchaeota archaeon]
MRWIILIGAFMLVGCVSQMENQQASQVQVIQNSCDELDSEITSKDQEIANLQETILSLKEEIESQKDKIADLQNFSTVIVDGKTLEFSEIHACTSSGGEFQKSACDYDCTTRNAELTGGRSDCIASAYTLGCECGAQRCWDGESCVDLSCKPGYIIAPVPKKASEFYCKIDKEWEDFLPCDEVSDCEKEEICVAQETPYGDTGYRCIPYKSYKLECTKYLDGNSFCY